MEANIEKLLNFIEGARFSSLDHYDLWTTKPGIFSRRLYHEHKLIGFPLAALIQVIDTCFPGVHRLVGEKNISAEAMPYFASAYCRLFKVRKEKKYLTRAIECLAWLEANSTKTASGLGWGLHFDWQTRELIKKNTPCVTITGGGTSAFLEVYGVTANRRFFEIARNTAEFVMNDLNRKQFGREKTAVSYTPDCQIYVINANSYACKILHEVYFNGEGEKKEYIDLADKILNYILDEQNPDGSWFYWDRSEKDNFIDCFHTAFVLENLIAIFLRTSDKRIKDALVSGFDFFKRSFIRKDFSCRHYYKDNRAFGIETDIRSCAEAINCVSMFADMIPGALDLSKKIALWTIENMQDKKGYFYFRRYKLHTDKMPYMRWAQAPMLNALVRLEETLSKN